MARHGDYTRARSMTEDVMRSLSRSPFLSDVENEFGKCDAGCPFAPGDMNEDGMVTLLDVNDFVDAVLNGGTQCQGDFTGPDGIPDGVITLLDVALFVAAILGG